LTRFLRAYGVYLLGLVFGISVLIGVSSFLRTDMNRSRAYDIVAEVNEVQWRSSQAREKMVSIMGWARLAARSNDQEYRSKILLDANFLAINTKTLVGLTYVKKIMPQVDVDQMSALLELVNKHIKPQLELPNPNYDGIVSGLEELWPRIVLTTTGNLGNTQKRTADLEQKALYDNFFLAFVFAFAIVIMVTIMALVTHRSKSLYNDQVRQFALLFSHMTFTRISGLSMWMHETLSPEDRPDPALLEMARKRIDDLSVVTDWLARIAYPKFDRDNTPIVALSTILDEMVRSNVAMLRADAKATQLLVPQGQFHLMLQELLRNSRDAVDGVVNPEIIINVQIGHRWSFGRDLIISIEDNGIGMTSDQIKKATTPFFSTKGESRGHSGLGLTGCARLIQTMGGSLAIQSIKGKGTTVTLRCPLSHLPAIRWKHT